MKFLNQSLVALLACLPVIWQSVVPSNETDGNVSTQPQDSSSSDSLVTPLFQHKKNNLINLDDETLFYRLKREQNKRLLAKPDESENSFPFVFHIIDQMAQWGFEYFETQLEYYKSSSMRIILNKNFFSYSDFELVCELMDDKKQDWTELELIRLLEIGVVECLANKEVMDRIVFVVAMEIFEGRLLRKIVTLFRGLQANIKKAVTALRHPSISIENGILQLDGSKILRGNDKIAIVKYFLIRATAFSNARFINFNFTPEIVKSIDEQLRNDSIIFYTKDKQAKVCLGNGFDRFEEILYSNYLDFTVKKTKNISSLRQFPIGV